MSSSFTRAGGGSIVSTQPSSEGQRVHALQALVSCPTSSIHSESTDKVELRLAQEGLPRLVPGCSHTYHCGWHSVKSFSSASYLIVRPQGNILVDSPRYNTVLAKRIEALGRVSTIFLTHKDDVADHLEWSRHFGCPRILHTLETENGTKDVEVQLQGEGPWILDSRNQVKDLIPGHEKATGVTGGEVASGSLTQQQQQSHDITLIFTPGHTKGHVCLLDPSDQALLSGDHLSQVDSVPDGTLGAALHVFTDFNWYSVSQQLSSVSKLKQYSFLTVLPGHGRIAHFCDAYQKDRAIEALLAQHQSRCDS